LLEEYNSFEKEDWQAGSWSPSVMHVSVWDLIGGYSVEFSPAHYSDPDVAMKLWYAGKINVGKLNVDHNPTVSVNYGITSIPAILFIKGGKVVDKQIGAVPKSVLDKKIQAHL